MGGLHQFLTLLLSLFSFSLRRVTQEARLLSGIVDFPVHVIAYISSDLSRKFGKGWPIHLPAIHNDTFYLSIKMMQNNFQRKRSGRGLLAPPP